MTPRVSRPAILLGAGVFVAVAVLTSSAIASVQTGSSGAGPVGSARAAAATNVSLPALMLETSDLPAGFRPYLPLTGPLNAQRARVLGGEVAQVAALLHGWVRYWLSTLTGMQVVEESYDLGTGDAAR